MEGLDRIGPALFFQGTIALIHCQRYDRLLQRDPNERLLQYAGKRVRCAVIVVESKDRIPVEIVKSQYSHLSIDSEGWLLMEWDAKEARLAMDMLEPVMADKNKQVVHARHKFARKRYAREYLWQPSPEIEVAIHKAIFG